MAPPRTPPKARILARIERADAGCWLWRGSVTRDGYGQIGIGRRQYRAHRVAYEEFVGVIPAGLWVLHRCDTPLCVNPEHLFLGTARDNAADRQAKGRGARQDGEAGHSAKLTNYQAWCIRRLRSTGATLGTLAEFFGTSFQNVSYICRMQSYRSIDNEAMRQRAIAAYANWKANGRR